MTLFRTSDQIAAALALVFAASASFAQTTPAPAKDPEPAPKQVEPKAEPAKTEPKPEPKPEPSLDELLGLPKATSPTPKPPADKPNAIPDQPVSKPGELDPAKAELERMLSPKEATEQFEQAVQLMGVAARRVQTNADIGLETQRIQQDVLRKLDKLIDDAQKKQSQSKSQSSKQQQQQQQQQQGQQQQQQAKQQSNQRQTGNEANRTNQLPGRQDGPGKAPPAGSAASWGNLPAHLRQALQQGLNDQYSSVYRAKTEAYYKRLAEEPKTGTAPSGGDK